jgi:hypothetical protein
VPDTRRSTGTYHKNVELIETGSGDIYTPPGTRRQGGFMQLLDDYFKLQEQIYRYFGYVEDWVVIPLDDATDVYWHLTGEQDGEAYYCYDKENLEKLIAADMHLDGEGVDGDDVYSDEIYTQRFLPKWVYRGQDFTMVCVDTHTDGNKFLRVFDNVKEVKMQKEASK